MVIREKNGIKYCVFENIEKTGLVKHCFSTRAGGVSEGVFDSLNISYTRGDKKENVDENIKRLCECINIKKENIVNGHQVHGKKILKVTGEYAGKNGITDYDAFITNEKDIVLSTFHADCVPIFMVDTKNKAIAMIHSGWRGTVQKIVQATLEKMHSEYGTKAKDVSAAIGPSIGMCCFQVNKPVLDEFINKMAFAKEFIKKDTDNIHFKIDLWGINKRLLEEKGVTDIELTDKCTMCNEDLFFSHRRMGNNRGSMAAYICLK